MSKNAWLIAGIAASGITAALALREVLRPEAEGRSTVKTSQSSDYSKKRSRRDGGSLFDSVAAAVGSSVASVTDSVSTAVSNSVSSVSDSVSSYTPSYSSSNDSSGGSYDGGGSTTSY